MRGAVWNLLGYLIAGGAALALPFVLVKGLGRGAYGVYSYVVLLLTQSYLLLGGLGEALAYYLANRQSEAKWWIRQALGAALFTGGVGLALWVWLGPEMIAWLLALDSSWKALLKEVRIVAGLALVGYAVAILLGWVPLALGRHRGLVLLPIGQTIVQAVFPMGVVLMFPGDVRRLLEVSLYGGVGLGVCMWAAISTLMREPLWPLFGWQAWKALWKRGLWQNLSQWNGLFLTFFERTVIGRWASLGYMGLYSAGQYFSSKAYQVLYKGVESLLPAFGGEASLWRRHLRLGQTMWLVALFTGPLLMLTYGIGRVGLPYFVRPWGIVEMRLWGGVIVTTQFLFLLAPLMPFFTGQGRFRIFYLYSLIFALFQVGGTLWLVPRGYYYWGPVVGGIGGLFFLTGFVFKGWGVSGLWRVWVWYPLWRLLIGWGIALGPLVVGGIDRGIWSLLMSVVGVGVFLISEKHNRFWPRKRDFLAQAWRGAWGFLSSKVKAIQNRITRAQAVP